MPEKVLVLKSGVCSWARCCFCGYGRAQGKEPVYGNLKKEFDSFLGGVEEGDIVKVFGSGSFLDEKQVPADARRYFIEECMKKGVKKVFIESRPEYVTKDALREWMGFELSIAMGLEVADDEALKKINKGFSVKDFESAAELIHSGGFFVKTYLLVNPPYVRDIKKSLEDSVGYALKHSDSIVLINLLPHGNTEVFRMWLRGEWTYLSREEFRQITSKWKDNPKISLDEETFRFVPKFPKEAMEGLKGVGEEYLTHPHYEVWQDYLLRWYRPNDEKDILLLLPCSYRKPYSQSDTHKEIIRILRENKCYDRIHQVMLSNAGVVPREFENNYPFNAYDWDERLETEEIKKRYIQVTEERITKYLKAHKENYSRILCYLKYGSESYRALENACLKLNLGLTNLLTKETYQRVKEDKKPLQNPEALNALREGLKKL